ncbi:hypothetical protein AMELA_G00258890 [Ameiurus melas]|uniref:Uncharacterized protein n=1 Tax=Ameiurus melas TaxID=219545 RepID=A0A7J5ZSA4_AMEME|nr:hypothetical protein AMELA_G00258890 [Ameiurus melas]
MAVEKRVTEFLRGRVGNLGISSIVLVVLEKIMDNDFICPCQPGYNEWICACYAAGPSIFSFVFTLFFVDPKPDDKVMKGKSTCDRFLYSALVAFIWLFLFFVDGGYVSCACSRWGGEYTETGALKWCKPTGNETSVFESQEKTERCITISQFAGFGIVLVISIILGISLCCKSRCEDGVQQNGEPQEQNRDVPLSYRNNDGRA